MPGDSFGASLGKSDALRHCGVRENAATKRGACGGLEFRAPGLCMGNSSDVKIIFSWNVRLIVFEYSIFHIPRSLAIAIQQSLTFILRQSSIYVLCNARRNACARRPSHPRRRLDLHLPNPATRCPKDRLCRHLHYGTRRHYQVQIRPHRSGRGPLLQSAFRQDYPDHLPSQVPEFQ